MQRRRVPREVERPEWVQALPSRLRADGGLRAPREGSARPQAFPRRPGKQPAVAQGGRRDAARRRQADRSVERRLPAHRPLDPPGHALRQAHRPDRRVDRSLAEGAVDEAGRRAAARRPRPLHRRLGRRRHPRRGLRGQRQEHGRHRRGRASEGVRNAG